MKSDRVSEGVRFETSFDQEGYRIGRKYIDAVISAERVYGYYDPKDWFGCACSSTRFRLPGNPDWLEGDFSVGVLMAASVLLKLRSSGMLDDFGTVATYVARGEARPAYPRAVAA